MIISFILFGIYLFLIFLGRKEPDKNPFWKMAGYLVNKSPMKQINSESVKENLKILHPLEAATKQAEIYYKEKLAFVLTVVFVGNCLVFLVGVNNWQTSNLENNRIMRDSYEGQKRFIKLLAAVGESKKELVLEIAPIKYNRVQIEEIFDEMEEKIRKEMLLENESFDVVRSDLYFPGSLEGYPVEISYETDNYEYVDIDGTVKNQALKEPFIVSAKVTLSYETYMREFTVPFTLYPKKYTKEETLFQAVEQAIAENDKKQATKEELILPQKVGDKTIVYEEIKDNSENTLFLLVIGTGILLYLLKDRELSQEVEKRRKTLVLEYPEFISKFTLLTGAGMPVKAALKKLAMDYKNNEKMKGQTNITYEELLITMYEMESGVLEEAAYDHFGKRCEIPQYIKFSGLLIQNLKKGSKDMAATLEKEVRESFEERKNNGRRLGEEAGTKLLLPMMLMLGIVMVLIIVPAFLSYQI
ncbi:MAG: type II secretion system F family protein [Lachnospiraceae bacterium]|nr:type II secretion system F family protein [Lachnospiraceae bacterium]